MKSKIYLFGIILSVLLTLGSCKSKQSAYKAAYEAAKEKEITPVEEVTPVEKPRAVAPSTASSATAQKEKITGVDGAGVRRFNVVIGSFTNKTNAVSLKERMGKQGFSAFLAQNERGMYRVIVVSVDEKSTAASERDRLKEKYYPDFQDAWILERQ
jgi:cell division protein FtsN